MSTILLTTHDSLCAIERAIRGGRGLGGQVAQFSADSETVWDSGERFDAVMAAELELLDGAVRRDPDRVRELLHPDFIEIGRSGRRWTRDETIASLAAEQERITPETDEWSLDELSPGLVLVTYRITSATLTSRHASLWDVSGSAPVIRYHQGTVLRSGD